MFENILNLKGAKKLSRTEQKQVIGGAGAENPSGPCNAMNPCVNSQLVCCSGACLDPSTVIEMPRGCSGLLF